MGKGKFIVYADKVARQRDEVKREKELLKVKVEEYESRRHPLSVKLEIPNYEMVANNNMVKIDSNTGELEVNFDDQVRKDVVLRNLYKSYTKYIF